MVVGLAVGLVAGVVSGLVRVHLGGGFVDTWGNSIGAWLVVPFGVGAMAHSRHGAAAAGALASTAQLAVFYAVTGTADAMAFWFTASVGAGAAFGGLGFTVWRTAARLR